MVIQLDVDGTITHAKDFFAAMSSSMRRQGHTVLVASCRSDDAESTNATLSDLQRYGIEFDALLLNPPLETILSRLPEGLNEQERLHFYKLLVAKQYKTDVAFEDDPFIIELFRKHLPDVQVFQVLFHEVISVRLGSPL